MKRLQLTLYISIITFLLMPPRDISAQKHQHAYGEVKFETSCNQEAQQKFNTGLALLHHMMYEQAEATFTEAGQADPNCAIAHWGVAMSVIHPLWGERPTDEQLEKGRKAIARAQSLNPQTEREAAYVEALRPIFEDWENTEYPTQLVYFEEGFKKVHESFPDDIDGAAFYALGRLATAPKDDKSFAQQKKAGKMLEELHARAPEHPGLFHYTIHAYDNVKLADRAAEVAQAYDKVAPQVPHALHMPTHIFVRTGNWSNVIEWNIRSAAAALKHPVEGMTSAHYSHALDYLMYAYLQQGKDKRAKEVLDKIKNEANLQPSLSSAYALAAVYSRYVLERAKWEEAAGLEVHPQNTFELDAYPAAESIVYFTKGLGAARSGDFQNAGEAINSLNELHQKLTQIGEDYWAMLADAQRTTVKAWLAYSKGDKEQALALMKEAADKEDSVDKHPVTPGHVLPARELLGDMLLEMNKPAEALAAYEASLESSANRFNSLYGAGYAAELLGNKDMAKSYYTSLIDISSEDEMERPAFFKAQEFLAKTSNK